LGYGFDANAAPLVEAIAKLHDGRWLRSEEISRKLALKGMAGALEGAREIQQELGDSGNAPARPHFADWMVREGFVKDRAEAFRKWLGAGKLGDVKQHWPTLDDTVDQLHPQRVRCVAGLVEPLEGIVIGQGQDSHAFLERTRNQNRRRQGAIGGRAMAVQINIHGAL
jgi:predicted metal-dependent phosphoesterase TrpH